MATLQRGGDCQVLLRQPEACCVARVVQCAKSKADGTQAPGLSNAAKRVLAKCMNGHEYTEANTWRSASGIRRCKTCRRANQSERRRRLREDALYDREIDRVGCGAEVCVTLPTKDEAKRAADALDTHGGDATTRMFEIAVDLLKALRRGRAGGTPLPGPCSRTVRPGRSLRPPVQSR